MTIANGVLWLFGMSFFYVNWIFGGKGDVFSAETVYFGLLFVFSLILFNATLSGRRKTKISGLALLHLILLILVGISIIWSPSKITAIREFSLFFYVYIFHILGRGISPNKTKTMLWKLFNILLLLAAISLAFVAIGFFNGTISFSFDSDLILSDVYGLFILPLDLASITLFFAVAIYFSGGRHWKLYLAILISLFFLVLNFSKTYLVATFIAILFMLLIESKGKLKKYVIFSAAILAGLLLIFTDNVFSRQLFWNPESSSQLLSLSADDLASSINTSGRLSIWAYIIENNASGYFGSLAGSGLGATKHILYTNPWGGIALAAHSDYVRIIGDFGYIGLCAYVILLPGLTIYHINKLSCDNTKFGRFVLYFIIMSLIFFAIGGIGYEFLNRSRTSMACLAFFVGAYWNYDVSIKKNLSARIQFSHA